MLRQGRAPCKRVPPKTYPRREATSVPGNPQANGPPPLRRRLLSLPTAVSFAVAGVFLFFLFSRFNVDLADTWQRVQESRPWYYLAAFAVYYASFPVRGLRWRIIATNAHLDSKSSGQVPSAYKCAQFILLGWFVNTISWFRLGDAYRAYAFSEDSGASFSRTFGTIVAERVVDIVAVFLLLLMAAGTLVSRGGVSPLLPRFLGAALLMVGIGGGALLLMRHLGLPLARFLPRRLAGAYQRLYEGTMGSFRQLPLVGLLSLAAWLLEAGRLLLVLHSLDLSLQLPLVLFVATASALLTTVPITPGGLGIVELGATGLLMLELPRGAAVSATLLDRSISYLSIVVIGGVFFLLRQARRRGLRSAPPASQELP